MRLMGVLKKFKVTPHALVTHRKKQNFSQAARQKSNAQKFFRIKGVAIFSLVDV